MADRRPAAGIEHRGGEALWPQQYFRVHGARRVRKADCAQGNGSERRPASSCVPVWTTLHEVRQAPANAAGESLRGLRTTSAALSHAAEAAEIARRDPAPPDGEEAVRGRAGEARAVLALEAGEHQPGSAGGPRRVAA